MRDPLRVTHKNRYCEVIVDTVVNCVPECGFYKCTDVLAWSASLPLVSLQSVVSKNAVQFKGNAQHDAQEFLLWLLDRVHEDLNTVNPNIRPPIKVNYKSGFFLCVCARACVLL